VIKHTDYAEYVGEDPAALLCHRWNWGRRRASLRMREREGVSAMMGDNDEGWPTATGGGGWPTMADWRWRSAARVSGMGGRGGGVVAWSSLGLPHAPYMGSQALGWPAPAPNKLGEGFGFLLAPSLLFQT
jgi:hypothetical protein